MNLGQNTFCKNKQTPNDNIVTMSKYNLGEGNKFQTWKNSISETHFISKISSPSTKGSNKGPKCPLKAS